MRLIGCCRKPSSNFLFSTQRVINWTLSDKMRRIDVPIGVSCVTGSDGVAQILMSIAEAGVEIPFLQRDLHLRTVDVHAARRLLGQGDET